MNEQQANDAIRNHPTRVVARDAQGGVYAEGVAFSYSIVPVLGIRTDDGREIHWRHDLTELAPAEGGALVWSLDGRACPECREPNVHHAGCSRSEARA